jgi:hypothetical protein
VSVTWDKVGETAKSFSGAASSALVLLDSKYSILPLNPRLRDELLLVSIILAMVAGWGAHQYAKKRNSLLVGGLSLCFAILVLMAILWLRVDQSSPPARISAAAQGSHVLFFVFLGGAIGGFLR